MIVDAVLPLTRKDLPRAWMLKRSMDRFIRGMGVCWVVAPDHEVEDVRKVFMSQPYQVLPETEVVPELRMALRVPGWVRQQLVKLGIADRIKSDFFLTLDADVICIKPVSLDELLSEGRAVSHMIGEDLWPEWYACSARVLGLNPVRSRVTHNVTPCVLSRRAVLGLQEHLRRRFLSVRFPINRPDLALLWLRIERCLGRYRGADPWRLLLINQHGWTEYSLYFTFVEATGWAELYHSWSRECIYSVDGSVWYQQDLLNWEPRDLIQKPGPPYFLVVQSNTGVEPELVWERLGKYIDDESPDVK